MRAQCNDWQTLQKALRERRPVAFIASKAELHVWSTDDPKAGDHCQCRAMKWNDGAPRTAKAG